MRMRQMVCRNCGRSVYQTTVRGRFVAFTYIDSGKEYEVYRPADDKLYLESRHCHHCGNKTWHEWVGMSEISVDQIQKLQRQYDEENRNEGSFN